MSNVQPNRENRHRGLVGEHKAKGTLLNSLEDGTHPVIQQGHLYGTFEQLFVDPSGQRARAVKKW